MGGKQNATAWNASGADYTIVRVALAGQRRMGVGFDSAWRLALKMTRPDDRQALRETEGAWRGAYLREGFHTGGAFATMAEVGDEHDDAARQLVM